MVWATQRLIDERPEVVSRFVEATLEAVGYLKDNPDAAVALYIKRTSAAPQVAGMATSFAKLAARINDGAHLQQ